MATKTRGKKTTTRAKAKGKTAKKAKTKPAPARRGVSSAVSKVVGLKEVAVSSIKLSDRFNRSAIDTSSDEFASFAANISANGIAQPLLVRAGKKAGTYELIAGERRLHAAKLAKLKLVPVVIRKADDVQAGALQLAENMYREDLAPLEEALQLKTQLDAGVSSEDLAKQLGCTPRHIQRRVSITRLSAKWAKATMNPRLNVPRWPALLLETLAKLPEKIQNEIYKHYSRGWNSLDYDCRIPHVGDLERVAGNMTHDLRGSGWKMDDTELVKGAPACASCPSRSSTNPELWDDSGKHDYCLNPACWNKKADAHLAVQEAKLAEKHGQVVKLHSGYSTNSAGLQGLQQAKTVSKKTAGAVPALVVEGDEKGRTVYLKPTGKGSGGPAPKARPLQERKRELHQKRAKHIRAAFDDRLRDAKLDALGKDPATRAPVLLALAATFGTYRNVRGTEWSEYDDLASGKVGDAQDILWGNLCDTFHCIIGRSFSANILSNPDQFREDCGRVAGIIKVDLAELEADAESQYPTPKTWAAEEKAEKAKSGKGKKKGKTSAGKAKPK